MSTWDTFCQGNRIVSEVAVFELELEIGTLLARWWNSGSRIGGNDVACVVSGLPRQMLNPETSHAWFLVYHGRCCNHPNLPVLKVLRIAYWPVKEALEALDISKWTPSASRTWIKCLRTRREDLRTVWEDFKRSVMLFLRTFSSILIAIYLRVVNCSSI